MLMTNLVAFFSFRNVLLYLQKKKNLLTNFFHIYMELFLYGIQNLNDKKIEKKKMQNRNELAKIYQQQKNKCVYSSYRLIACVLFFVCE